MSLECAHCGARMPDGTPRCPDCLRTTGLMAVPDAPPPRARTSLGTRVALATVTAALVLAASGTVVWWFNHRTAGATASHPLDPAVRALVPPPIDTAPVALSPLLARVRTETVPLARARAALEAVRAHHVAVALAPADVPVPRDIASLTALLDRPGAGARVTSLDLARVVASLVRATGTSASVAVRTRAPRADEPADPSGLTGRYVVVVGTDTVDPVLELVAPASEAAPRVLDDNALTAAMLAQGALAALATRARDRALQLADASVRASGDTPVPLAVRAYVTRALGLRGLNSPAGHDLASALAMRDEAPLHLARARLALDDDDPASARDAIRAALARTPAWPPAAIAAALANVIPDASDRCAPLTVPRDPWVDDALLACRTESGDASARAGASARLAASSDDPLVRALAARGGDESALQVAPDDRHELAAWLVLGGRRDLAERVLASASDAGTTR